jgi:hypothetical protein
MLVPKGNFYTSMTKKDALKNHAWPLKTIIGLFLWILVPLDGFENKVCVPGS